MSNIHAKYNHSLRFELNKKPPIYLVLVSLFFIYALQYPLMLLVTNNKAVPLYGLDAWIAAYLFVIISTFIFTFTLFIGLSGEKINIYRYRDINFRSKKRISLTWVVVLFSIFGFWSYVMVKLNIGMTIWTNFAQLPFRITGILFYGRLFIQPLILAYISIGYADSRLKWIIYLLMVALGAWVSLSSGSRFAAILFALPMLLLFVGKARYLAFGLPTLVFIVIATISRSFYLPMVVGDAELIQIYANEAHQASTTENIMLLPISYLISRTMGIAEVMTTLSFGSTTPSFFDSTQVLISYFLPFIPNGSTVSIKNIYGFSDDEFGGFGLDIFSNFWVFFGGEPVLYILGLAAMGWLLGKTYRLFAIGMARFGWHDVSYLIFIILFILIFEGRGHLFPALILLGLIFSRRAMPRRAFALIKVFSLRRFLAPHQSHS